MRTLIVFLLMMFLTTGVFGQSKVGGVVIVNEKGNVLLKGCPKGKDVSDQQLVILDEFGNLISTSTIEGDVVELDITNLDNRNMTVTLISGDCKITKKIGK